MFKHLKHHPLYSSLDFDLYKTKSADGKRAKRFDFDRDGEEAEVIIGQGVERGEVFDDGDVVAQQGGMDGTAAVVGVVDVVGVDADQDCAGLLQVHGRFPRQKCVPLKILFGVPMLRPASVK